jgi:hypothetical protein
MSVEPSQITIDAQAVFVIIAAAVLVVILLRYGRAIVRLLSALGGLLFLALVAVGVALALGVWTPDTSGLLVKILEAVTR